MDIILNNQLEDIKVSYKLFAVNALGCLALIIIYLIIVGIRLKVNPLVFLKKATQTLLICLITASSAAAFSTSLETCKKRYGIDESFTDFGVPFAQVIYKPSVATPPIPGGALASISVLFAQLGLPSGGLAVVLALNIILDFIETPTDIFGGHSMLILSSKQLGLIDEKTMRSK